MGMERVNTIVPILLIPVLLYVMYYAAALRVATNLCEFNKITLIMPGLANSYLQIIIITVRVVGPAVDVVRRH